MRTGIGLASDSIVAALILSVPSSIFYCLGFHSYHHHLFYSPSIPTYPSTPFPFIRSHLSQPTPLVRSMAVDCHSQPPVLPHTSLEDSEFDVTQSGFYAVQRDPTSWNGSLPASQGLYENEYEKDSCGVGFICHIKGQQSHKIVSDARQLLCAMTHRGATGADSRDGDGAGVMTGIPHHFFKREAERDIGCELPDAGHYAVGNVFFKPNDPVGLQKQQSIFSKIAADLGLRVLGWRAVPTDGTILGPAAASKEPLILQPFVVLRAHYGDGNVSRNGSFDAKHFECQLYVLRKHATHSMFVISFFQSTDASLTPSELSHSKYALQGILRLFVIVQEYRVQRPTFASASVQLLP